MKHVHVKFDNFVFGSVALCVFGSVSFCVFGSVSILSVVPFHVAPLTHCVFIFVQIDNLLVTLKETFSQE